MILCIQLPVLSLIHHQGFQDVLRLRICLEHPTYRFGNTLLRLFAQSTLFIVHSSLTSKILQSLCTPSPESYPSLLCGAAGGRLMHQYATFWKMACLKACLQLLIAPMVPAAPTFSPTITPHISCVIFCIWSPVGLEMKGLSLDFQDGIKVMHNLSCPFSLPIDDRHPRFLQIYPLWLRPICLSPPSWRVCLPSPLRMVGRKSWREPSTVVTFHSLLQTQMHCVCAVQLILTI